MRLLIIKPCGRCVVRAVRPSARSPSKMWEYDTKISPFRLCLCFQPPQHRPRIHSSANALHSSLYISLYITYIIHKSPNATLGGILNAHRLRTALWLCGRSGLVAKTRPKLNLHHPKPPRPNPGPGPVPFCVRLFALCANVTAEILGRTHAQAHTDSDTVIN